MTVFAVQRQIRWDHENQIAVDRFPTIRQAEKWGSLEFVLSQDNHPFNIEPVLGSLHEALSGFSDDDFLLLVGNPMLMGVATAIAAYYNDGRVRFLQWSPKQSDYVVVSTRIF